MGHAPRLGGALPRPHVLQHLRQGVPRSEPAGAPPEVSHQRAAVPVSGVRQRILAEREPKRSSQDHPWSGQRDDTEQGRAGGAEAAQMLHLYEDVHHQQQHVPAYQGRWLNH